MSMSIISKQSTLSRFTLIDNNNNSNDNDNNSFKDDDDELSQLAKSLIDEYQRDNNSRVISLEEYASLVSNDVHYNNNNDINNNNNKDIKKKKKKNNNTLYVGNNENRKLINQYYNSLIKPNNIRKITSKKTTATSYALYNKADDINPIIDLISLETKPLVLASRPISRNSTSRPKSSRIGNRPNPQVIDKNTNSSSNNNNNTTFQTIRPKSANDSIRTKSTNNSIGNQISSYILNDSLTRDLNNMSNVNSLDINSDIIVKDENHELNVRDTSTSVASYMTAISVQVYSNSNSPRAISPTLSPQIHDHENTIRLKTNDIIKQEEDISREQSTSQQSPNKSPTRYSLTPTRKSYQDNDNDIFSPNAIKWDSALGGSMDNYINRLLLVDKPKQDEVTTSIINTVETQNKYDEERLSIYLGYGTGNDKTDDPPIEHQHGIKKSSRPIRSAVLSQEGNRLKEKKTQIEADMKRRNDEVATLVISNHDKPSIRPSTATSYHQHISKNKDYPISMSVPLKDLELEREFLLSLSKQLRQSKLNNPVYNSPRGEEFIDDNIINKISEQLNYYKNSLTWDSLGYKKVIEDIEIIRQKEAEEYLNIQKRMGDMSTIVFPKMNTNTISNTKNSTIDDKNTKMMSNSSSKKTLTNMKFSEKDLLAFPTYAKFNDPEVNRNYRNTSVLKFNSGLDDKSSLITLSLFDVSNASPNKSQKNSVINDNNTINELNSNNNGNEFEVKTGQDKKVIMKRLNIEKKVLYLPPVLKLESECMTFSPRESERKWQRDHSYKVRSQLEKGLKTFVYPADTMRIQSPDIHCNFAPPPPLGISSTHESFIDSSSSFLPKRPLTAPSKR